MDSPKEGAVSQQQHEIESTRNEGWMTSKVEGCLLEPVWCHSAIHEGDHHRCNREAALDQKTWRCAFRLLRMNSLKEGEM
jgi:hypothetical protein